MASTQIKTSRFYRQITGIAHKLQMPTMSLNEQVDLYAKIVRSVAHEDFAKHMKQYITELKLPEGKRKPLTDIRVRMEDWFALSTDTRIFMSEFLADHLKSSSILPDTYFLERKTIDTLSIERLPDGGIELEIRNEEDQSAVRHKFSLKQRFLVDRFLESITNSFDQIQANTTKDKRRKYTYEENDTLTSLFKANKDPELTEAVRGRHYFVLKYFIGIEDGRKKYYTHRTLSGNPEALKQDFLDSVTKGFVSKFTPKTFPRTTVPTVHSSHYDKKYKRLPSGRLNIHIWGDVGILEIRPKGAKSKDCFPFIGAILPTGELVMCSDFAQQSLIVEALNKA